MKKILILIVLLIILLIFKQPVEAKFIPDPVPQSQATPTDDAEINYNEAVKSTETKTGRITISTCFSIFGLGLLIYVILFWGLFQLDKHFNISLPAKIVSFGLYSTESNRTTMSMLLIVGFVMSMATLIITGELQDHIIKIMDSIYNLTKIDQDIIK